LSELSLSIYEIITVTEGDAESAKAIGLRKAKGEIVGIFASDNFLDDSDFLKKMMKPFALPDVVAASPSHYSYHHHDNILNRYFSILGANDPIPVALDKHDKVGCFNPPDKSYVKTIDKVRTYGDNGFFSRKSILMKADINHYYHIDVCQDLFDQGYRKYAIVNASLWHRTGGNVFKFFWKRFKYADQFMTPQRRWKMVTKKDMPKIFWFVLFTIMAINHIFVSVLGYSITKDKAWLLHWPICVLTIITYGALTIKRCFRS